MFASLQLYLLTLVTLALFIVEVFALVDAARRPASAFLSAGKRTKKFWVALTAAATVLGFIGLYPPVGGAYLGLMVMFVVIPSVIYLTDVRPAVSGYGGPRGGSGARGGW